MAKTSANTATSWRYYLVYALILVSFVGIALRLGYWQIFAGHSLSVMAQAQRLSTVLIPATRGQIQADDNFPLVTNQAAYLAYVYLPDLNVPSSQAAQTLAPLLLTHDVRYSATLSARAVDDLYTQIKTELTQKFASPTTWVPLARNLPEDAKTALQNTHLNGLGFESSSIRTYPEASMAAQLLGFVGSDGSGNPKGYFGLEGFYDLELSGIPGMLRQETDVRGSPIVIGDFERVDAREGSTIKTNLDRRLQLMVEQMLQKGVETYEASAGEVVIMDPQTGAILAMAAVPSYDPARYRDYPQVDFKTPSIADAYEPGSTFKVVVMSAAVNEGVVTPETVCDQTCNGPVTIGAYTIRTWNNEYRPGETMTDVLVHSDNTGMVFVSSRLGKSKFVDYVKSFGFGSLTGIDLQGEADPPLRDKWGDIDLATGSFGQGIAVTTIQMLSAVSAIANGGTLYEPHVAAEIISSDGNHFIAPRKIRQVISPQAAATVTKMMQDSAIHGEAQWTALKGYEIAGKTGTAQIPIQGHYDDTKTMASFVGFAPADHPRFAMIVKLREPQSSPWAAETAAPLWFHIAKEVFRLLVIPVPGNDT